MRTMTALALLLTAACTQQAAQPAANEANPVESQTTVVENEAPLNPPAPGEPGGLPDDRTPISEGPIDPKSAQGAGQVVQQYFALVESGKLAEASKLWSAGVERLNLAAYREVHASIGAPGNVEGGAGSLYVEIPIQLYGRLKDGKEFNSRGTMTLRRVNDVDGSTEEQRRWHIMNAEFANAT
jgi:hypothetical protein